MARDPYPQFTAAMFEIYRRAKVEEGYSATFFLQMLTDRHGLETARTLINARKESAGYTALQQLGRLDLTVEALVTENPKWRKLFTETELKSAEDRLAKYEYKPNIAK